MGTRSIAATLTIVSAVFVLATAASAIAMQSGTYKIDADDLDGSGLRSQSASFGAEDTIGGIATGAQASASYGLRAGYQQADPVTITISSSADITMTALSTTQNSAVGSAAWTVTTNDQAGYTLSVATTQYDALRDGGTGRYFTDFASSTPTTWSVSNAYKFGMSARGSHTTGFGSDADCIAGADVPSTTLLWTGFKSTTGIQIASSSSATVSGTTTTLCVADEQSGVLAPSGSYGTVIVATAVPL
jgi:hypothetical protein